MRCEDLLRIAFRVFPLLCAKKGERLPPKVREFIRFVLSREGQELVQKDGKYLPLNAEAAREELKKLK